MTESDDPVIKPIKRIIDPLIGRNQDDEPVTPVTAEPVTKTTTAKAASGGQLSETARKNRKRREAFRPRGFAPPTLGTTALLGA